MKTGIYIEIFVMAMSVLFAGCANQPQSPYPSQRSPNYRSYTNAVVDRIEVVRVYDGKNIAGPVIGGVVGGLIGNQIGGAPGQTAATTAGMGAGAFAGNEIEKRQLANDEAFRISLRMDDGSYQTVIQDDISELRTGERVRVEDGRIYRS